MDLEKSLKQFKRIEPDPTYTDYSRRAILASAQFEKLTMRVILMRAFEGAGSLALVGLLIFAVAGGFSGSRYLSPVQFAGIDPAALHAEAQAIDMQINLVNLTYTEADSVATAASTPRMMAAMTPAAASPVAMTAPSQQSKIAASSLSAGIGTATTTAATDTPVVSTPSSSVSINEALQKLTQ